MILWGVNLLFRRLSPSSGYVAYVFRTRLPVAITIAGMLPLDLHVLSLPLAFILSQDQTLHCKYDLQRRFRTFISYTLQHKTIF